MTFFSRLWGAALACALLLTTLAGVGHARAAQPAAADRPDETVCAAPGARILIDFGDLADADADDDSDVLTVCDDDVTGERADRSVLDAGVDLTWATRSPGFVCRVEGVPASDPCVNAAPSDAYWAIWWAAEASDTHWVYSAQGLSSLRTPQGGVVALVWHRGSGRATAPEMTPADLTGGSHGDSAFIDAGFDPGVQNDDGLPAWVPVALIAVVAGVGGIVVVRRRKAQA